MLGLHKLQLNLGQQTHNSGISYELLTSIWEY